MQDKNGFEIERKFLIAMPEDAMLKSVATRRLEISQTYLISSAGENSRVRKITEDGVSTYIYTQKKKISAIRRMETEYEISESEYVERLKNADPTRCVIQKVRYLMPYAGHTFEIDIFPFWADKAFLEIELTDEKESFELPPQIIILKEVTEDKRYTNAALAIKIPSDEEN